MPQRKRILINAMHTVTGGGVIYLQGILPELVKDARFEWVLLMPKALEGRVEIPTGVEVKTVPDYGFWRGHVFEQLQLPLMMRAWRISCVLCNANYVPLLGPRPVPIIHTTTRAAAQAVGLRMRIYWKVLKVLTMVSIWRAPVAISLAGHVVREYVQWGYLRRKVRLAPPAVTVAQAGATDPDLVLAVGDFYGQKNYPVLVRAFAVLRDQRPGARLVIVGKAVDAGVRDEVLKLVRELAVADGVTLTGAVPHDKLMEMMGKAAVFVSTSEAEAVQIPLLEAMAMGVPVVAAKAPHSDEFVGEAGVLVPVAKGGDVASAFAVALYGVLENRLVADVLRRKGMEKMEGKTWAASAHVILEALAGAVRLT